MIDIAASHRKRLGCSKIAQALGLSSLGTAYQLWEQYTGRAPWPNIGNQLRVGLGEPMEDVLRPFVADLLGRDLRRDRKEYLHESLPLNLRRANPQDEEFATIRAELEKRDAAP